MWVGEGWIFSAIFDAHATAESTDAALQLLVDHKLELLPMMESNRASDVQRLLTEVVGIFSSPIARQRLSNARGETAFLICFQQGRFLGWLSIGDNSLYLLHPQLAKLGQFTLSTRNYFEWIGRRDSLVLEVPCYSSGIRELRLGEQTVVLATDGLVCWSSRIGRMRPRPRSRKQ